jgi:hypothetical protein
MQYEPWFYGRGLVANINNPPHATIIRTDYWTSVWITIRGYNQMIQKDVVYTIFISIFLFGSESDTNIIKLCPIKFE